MLFADSLTDKTFVPCGISEVKPFDFSHLLGAVISSFIAYSKQEFSIEVSHSLFIACKFPPLLSKKILTYLIVLICSFF